MPIYLFLLGKTRQVQRLYLAAGLSYNHGQRSVFSVSQMGLAGATAALLFVVLSFVVMVLLVM